MRQRALAALERWLLRIWYGGATTRDRSLALLLAPIALPLGQLVAVLARSRRRQIRRQARDERPPVLIVGNLVAGGAGKTPTVIALARGLAARGHRVGLLARGYRAPDDRATVASPPAVFLVDEHSDATLAGDEPLLLARATACPVAVGADRAAALALLLARHPGLSFVIADDGLQHPGLPRAAELVLVDERGFGNGRCLPAGPLREPVDRLATVDAVLLHRREQLPAGTPRPRSIYHLRTAITGFRELGADRPWTPQALLDAVRASGQPLLAVAGIARPDRFFDDLRALGFDVEPRPLPDHATIDREWLGGLGPRFVAITGKDAVKLDEPDRRTGREERREPRIVVAEQAGELDEALLNWLTSAWPAPSGRP